MSVLGYRVRNHPAQIVRYGARDGVDDRATPPELFGPLNDRYGFTIDAAAAPHNAQLPRFWTKDDNGLAQSWAGERVWCNPPFSALEAWVRKAWAERDDTSLIVMLLPANRTEQPWWHTYVEPFRDRDEWDLRCEFLPGRPRFLLAPGIKPRGPDIRPPFGLCLLIWNGGTL